jgi:hypothetical protein
MVHLKSRSLLGVAVVALLLNLIICIIGLDSKERFEVLVSGLKLVFDCLIIAAAVNGRKEVLNICILGKIRKFLVKINFKIHNRLFKRRK